MAGRSRRNRRATCTSTRSRPGYFETLGTRVLRGRDFAAADTPTRAPASSSSTSRWRAGSSRTRIRSAAASPSAEASAGATCEIVGLVPDAKDQTLQEPARRIAYLPVAQQGDERNLFAEVRPIGQAVGDRRAASATEVRALDAGVPVRIETVTDRIRESLVKERVMARAGVGSWRHGARPGLRGLYGLLAYAVSRTGEGDRPAARARRDARGACCGSSCATA